MDIAGEVLLEQYRRGRQLWPVITAVEAELGLPPFLLWAEASRETNMDPRYAQGQVHADGHGWGLFGADDRWNDLDLPAFARDVEAQARLAGQTLRSNFARLGTWLDAVNAYGPAWARPAYGADVLGRATYLAAYSGGITPMRLVTRSQWGARSASTSTDITPAGVAVHWEGPHIGTFPHSSCAGLVRGIQAYHMDTNGWADIAYSAVACPHGYVFEGRGPGHRTAANGTNDGNQRFYAVCFLGGEGDVFTLQPEEGTGALTDTIAPHHGGRHSEELGDHLTDLLHKMHRKGEAEPDHPGLIADGSARDAIDDAIDWLAGGQTVGHRDLTETACPGDEIYAWVRSGHPRATTPNPPAPPAPPQPQQEDDMLGIFDGPAEIGGGIYASDGDRIWGVPSESWLRAFFFSGLCRHGGTIERQAFFDLRDRDGLVRNPGVGLTDEDLAEGVLDIAGVTCRSIADVRAQLTSEAAGDTGRRRHRTPATSHTLPSSAEASDG